MPTKILEKQAPMIELMTLFPNFQGVGNLPTKIFECLPYLYTINIYVEN